MLYLNKFLSKIKENSRLFKMPEIHFILGINSSQIKEIKKFAINNDYIIQNKQEYFLTPKGEDYLKTNPLKTWKNNEFDLRPEINSEYLKEEKTPSVLTKTIRNLAKHLLENQEIKEFSLEHLLLEDIKKCEILESEIKNDLLNEKKNKLDLIYEKYQKKGITKSLISIILLNILNNNSEKVAIYEKSLFQISFNPLMFDRMIACPENFELQKTEMNDEYLLKDISKIILNKKSNNILEITKGLYSFIKTLDKYTMNTQNLSKNTLRFRNVVLNAKDPISLFERDIPRAFAKKSLKDCDREFLNDLKNSINELKNCTNCLVKDLTKYIFISFNSKNRKDLTNRFLAIKEYIGDKELKTLFNNIIDISVDENLWTNRIATFINKQRVPKDWSDEDYSDFKVKTKELTLKFFVLEATLGTNDSIINKKYDSILKKILELPKTDQLILLRKVVNA